MVPGGTTELIWHFAGYLHIDLDLATQRVPYDGGALKVIQDDYVATLSETPFEADDQPFDTVRLRDPEFQLAADQFANLGTLKLAELENDAPTARKVGAALPPAPAPKGGGGGGGGRPEDVEFKIVIAYQSGSEILLQAHQLNEMADDDLLVINPLAVPDLPRVDVDAKLDHLSEAASDQTPADLAVPSHTTGAVLDLIKEHDANWVENNPHSVAGGYYVNGDLTPTPDAPEGTSPFQIEPTTPTDVSVPEELQNVRGEWAMTGANTAVNAALIVDVNEAAPTMIVLGDYFKTDAIVQTNSYVDKDKVEVAGGQAAPDIATGGNTADNLAAFDYQPGIYPDLTGNFAGLAWQVDLVEGDYFDIRLLTQTNYLADGDVVVQDTQQAHYEAHTGENGLYNLSNVNDGAEFRYDLIIIAGDYHGGNFIFQNNILLDHDIVKMLGLGDPGAQSVSTGDNALLNHGVIQTYGGNMFLPVSAGMNELITALDEHPDSLDPSFGTIVPGRGFETFNILYVTGDYYDVNAIWQNNVIADLDTAIQFFSAQDALLGGIPGITIPEDGPDTVQSIATGGNKLTNDAAIVDVGANDTHVDGEVYTDAILVQANLVTDDKDKVIHSDPQALASELVAFVTPAVSEEQDDISIAPVNGGSTSDDMLAGVMY